MAAYKNLTQSERIVIDYSLNALLSFKAIGNEIDKDCTTISKEIRRYRNFKKTDSYGRPFNNCLYRHSCDAHHICGVCMYKNNHRYCRFCRKCSVICPRYKAEICPNLSKPPYICNGCADLKQCTFEKAFYNAVPAQKEYEMIRSESRSGIRISEAEAKHLDGLISPLIRKWQSIHRIIDVIITLSDAY